ncbi:MAG TPA: AsmA-like C-terminal domain-containing protein [Mariprofundaceae bacterium]|nr:AsmA-like C-terminal domain-containing protein [Mariprofundaceae bacterium]
MTGKLKLIRALAACRRVFLLLALGVTVLGAVVYSQSPSLDVLRPQIESYLKQQLHLREIKLGPLSWYWAGFLWLESEQLDFDSEDGNIVFHDGAVAVRISILSVLRGNLVPDHIRLSRGTLDLVIPDTSEQPATAPPSHQLQLENVNVHWRFGHWRGNLPNLDLQIDGPSRSLHARSASLGINARLSEDGLPEKFDLHCEHTDWLPESLRSKLSGTPTLAVNFTRKSARKWHLSATLTSEQPTTLMPDSLYSLPLNSMSLQATLQTSPEQALSPELIRIDEAAWQLGDHRISAHGTWQNQQLMLAASSEHLDLPMIWSWMKPFGNASWHHWLSSMHHGSATAITAKLALPWTDPLHQLPMSQGKEGLAFSVHATVKDADIALGSSKDTLNNLDAEVDINEKELSARIDNSTLPHQLGSSSGKLTIPWSTLELQIKGHAQIDAVKLLAWKGPQQSQTWKWQQGATDATYAITWRADEPTPRTARAELQPVNMWDVSIQNIPLHLTGGTIEWDQDTGMRMQQMQVMGERMQGTLSLAAAPNADRQWRLISMDAQGQGDLGIIAGHFQLPMSHPSGMLSTSLRYDGSWSGKLDLMQSSWDHLLGSRKTIGEPFSLVYEGSFDQESETPSIHLTTLHSSGGALQAEGQARLSQDGLRLNLKHLKTPAFDGSLNIYAPFGEGPWEINADANYLNRNALPEKLEHIESAQDKPWSLRARISRFDWADARMSGVHVKLASTTGSTGIFEASQIHTARLDILDVNAMFSLLGKGEIDLKRLRADVEKQHLSMYAHLVPEADGGMRWNGFALIQGDFGYLMQRGSISKKFESGLGHVLFSGHGVMLREQPWWQGLDGRLRLRVDSGRILEGGTLTTFLSAISLTDLPELLIGKRKDLGGPGIMYKRLQMEAVMQNQNIQIRNLAMRSSAFDLAGHGKMDIDKDTIDLYLIARPLQNLDAILSKIPLLRDLLGGRAHSFMRKIYRMHGPFTHAEVDAVSPEEAGLVSGGLVEHLFNLPESWFGKSDKASKAVSE